MASACWATRGTSRAGATHQADSLSWADPRASAASESSTAAAGPWPPRSDSRPLSAPADPARRSPHDRNTARANSSDPPRATRNTTIATCCMRSRERREATRYPDTRTGRTAAHTHRADRPVKPKVSARSRAGTANRATTAPRYLRRSTTVAIRATARATRADTIQMPPGLSTAAAPASTIQVERRDRPAASVTTTAKPKRSSTSGRPTPVGCTDDPTEAMPVSTAMAHTNRRSSLAARRIGGGGRARSLLGAAAPGHSVRHRGGRAVELVRRRRRTAVSVAAPGDEAPAGGGGRSASGGASRTSSRSGVRAGGVGRLRRREPTSASNASSADTSRSPSDAGRPSGSSGRSPDPVFDVSMGGGWPSSPGRFGWCPSAPDVGGGMPQTVVPRPPREAGTPGQRIILRSRRLGYAADKIARDTPSHPALVQTSLVTIEDARRSCRDPNQLPRPACSLESGGFSSGIASPSNSPSTCCPGASASTWPWCCGSRASRPRGGTASISGACWPPWRRPPRCRPCRAWPSASISAAGGSARSTRSRTSWRRWPSPRVESPCSTSSATACSCRRASRWRAGCWPWPSWPAPATAGDSCSSAACGRVATAPGAS